MSWGRRGPGQLDLRRAHQLAARRDDVVGEKRRLRRVVEEEQLAGGGIDLGVGRDAPREPTAEALGSQRREGSRVEPVRLTALIPEREHGAVVEDEIGVRRVLEPAVRAAARHLGIGPLHVAGPERAPSSALLCETLRAHPAVAIRGASVAEGHGMHHAVAVEPVVAAPRREDGIGTIAQEHTVEVARKLSHRRQVRVALVEHGRERALEIGVLGLREPSREAVGCAHLLSDRAA
jgi:hypothetical protein